MEFIKKNPKIYIISGKSGSGKTETTGIFKSIFNDKCIELAFSYSIKHYTKKITGWDGSNESKPREFLQQLGVELIKEKIDPNLVINRMIEDIKVYSYFYDVIVISDARFIEEIENIRDNFDNVIVLRLERDRENSLSEKEKKHISETALDNYNNYDYIIKNNDLNLKEKILKIVGD